MTALERFAPGLMQLRPPGGVTFTARRRFARALGGCEHPGEVTVAALEGFALGLMASRLPGVATATALVPSRPWSPGTLPLLFGLLTATAPLTRPPPPPGRSFAALRMTVGERSE
jgi:hypothetical protein